MPTVDSIHLQSGQYSVLSPGLLRGAVERLEFWPVNVMFGRRFPFLPSNWCRGILGFKRGRWKKKLVWKAERWGWEK